jgi:NMD protein affecting ribosome stability and mRNA decay
MAYIYCEHCGVGFHSNVRTCPECGRGVRRVYQAGSEVRTHHALRRRGRAHAHALREDVESEVREEIYGWRSGSVEVGRSAAPN